MHSRTRRNPGSDSPGVPASVIRATFSPAARCSTKPPVWHKTNLYGEAYDEEKLLPFDDGIVSPGRLRGRTNDGDNDYDHAGSDNRGASSRGTGDETSATGSR